MIDRLKKSAGVIDVTSGNFSQAGYNKALESVRPKLSILFDPEHAQQVEKLGRVARYTQEQPRGAFVNTSNTLTGHLAEHAKGAAEVAVNAAVPGADLGTKGRGLMGRYSNYREAQRTWQPGAGVKLREVGK